MFNDDGNHHDQWIALIFFFFFLSFASYLFRNQSATLEVLEDFADNLQDMIEKHRVQIVADRRKDVKKEANSFSLSQRHGQSVVGQLFYKKLFVPNSPPSSVSISRKGTTTDRTDHDTEDDAIVTDSLDAYQLLTSSNPVGRDLNRTFDVLENDSLCKQFTSELNLACWRGKTKLVKRLIEKAASVFSNKSDYIHTTGNHYDVNLTPTQLKTDSENDVSTRHSCASSIDMNHNQSDKGGETATKVKALNARDAHGHTALICAVQRDHSKVVEILLSQNAR